MEHKRYSLILYESVRKILEKLNYDVVCKFFEQNGYSIVGEYHNANTAVVCKKDSYRYKISYSNLKLGKKPSMWGFNNLDNLDYNISILMQKRNFKALYLGHDIIVKSKKRRILLHFQCVCGKKFDKILEDAVYGKYILCPACTLRKRGESKRAGEVVEFLKSKGFTVIDESRNYRRTDYVEVEDAEGYKGFVTYANVKNKKSGLSRFDVRVNKKYYIYNVNKYAELQNLNIECLELVTEKLHSRQSLKFRCSCGNEFVTSLASFQNGKTRCNICAKSESRYEFKFEEYLKRNKIDYIFQYSLNQCRDILPLPFDFYIKEYDCLVEIDGEGHYHPCNFNQISNESAIKTYEITKKHDEIKTKYCEENNIPLLRISYKDFADENYKQLFQSFVGELANSN